MNSIAFNSIQLPFPRNNGPLTPEGVEAQKIYDRMKDCANTLADIKRSISLLPSENLLALASLDHLTTQFFEQLHIAQEFKNCPPHLFCYSDELNIPTTLLERNIIAVQTDLTTKYQTATQNLSALDKIADWLNKSPLREKLFQPS